MPGGETGPQEREHDHPAEHKGLSQRLKDMIFRPDGDPAKELEERRAASRQVALDRQAARTAHLQARAESGEVPVVPSSERYQTGQTPIVPPAEAEDSPEQRSS